MVWKFVCSTVVNAFWWGMKTVSAGLGALAALAFFTGASVILLTGSHRAGLSITAAALLGLLYLIVALFVGAFRTWKGTEDARAKAAEALASVMDEIREGLKVSLKTTAYQPPTVVCWAVLKSAAPCAIGWKFENIEVEVPGHGASVVGSPGDRLLAKDETEVVIGQFDMAADAATAGRVAFQVSWGAPSQPRSEWFKRHETHGFSACHLGNGQYQLTWSIDRND